MNKFQRSDRFVGLTIGTFLLVLSGLLYLVFDADVGGMLIAAVLVLVTALLVPTVLLPLNRLWILLGLRLSEINNFALLGLFYGVFIMPYGFVMRLFGYDPMARAIKFGKSSYWKKVARNSDKENLKDMF